MGLQTVSWCWFSCYLGNILSIIRCVGSGMVRKWCEAEVVQNTSHMAREDNWRACYSSYFNEMQKTQGCKNMKMRVMDWKATVKGKWLHSLMCGLLPVSYCGKEVKTYWVVQIKWFYSITQLGYIIYKKKNSPKRASHFTRSKQEVQTIFFGKKKADSNPTIK